MPSGSSPRFSARVKGRNGKVREYSALVVPTSEFCILPTVDAYSLGYPEVISNNSRIPPKNSMVLATYSGYTRGLPIRIPQVDIGSISSKDVEFLVIDLPQVIGFDMVLGQSLLRCMRVEMDFSSRTLKIEGAAGPR